MSAMDSKHLSSSQVQTGNGNSDEPHSADHTDQDSIASNNADESTMEPFDDYKHKIEQLLATIGLHEFSIEPIQHGLNFNNCVYALNSLTDTTKNCILRVSINEEISDSDGKHVTLDDDNAVLNFLKHKLPVPQVINYSATTDNVLEAAYTIQTKIPGETSISKTATSTTINSRILIFQTLKRT